MEKARESETQFVLSVLPDMAVYTYKLEGYDTTGLYRWCGLCFAKLAQDTLMHILHSHTWLEFLLQ